MDATCVKKREAGASLRGEFPKLGKLMDDEVFTPTCTAWASGRIWPAPS